jgi:arsenate reductase-like glutaredoxin family protein
LSPGELQSIAASIPSEDLIDTDSKLYKKKGMAYMEFDIIEELMENPALIKTPVVRFGKKAVLGFEPEQWQNLMGED